MSGMDPLHQFAVESWGGFGLSNATFFMILAAGLGAAFFSWTVLKTSAVPSKRQAAGELFYTFVRGMLQKEPGSVGANDMAMVFSLFVFILFGNLLGLFPYAFTFTSHIVATLVLALVLFTFLVGMGIAKHGWGVLRIFAPRGLPKALYIILIPVEFFSFLIRPFSLAIRLCANMIAGHTMLKVFAGLAAMAGFIGVIPIGVNALLMGFELFVAVLQAYIFTTLACLYLNDMKHLH